MENTLIWTAVEGANASIEFYEATTPPEDQRLRDVAVYATIGGIGLPLCVWLAKKITQKFLA